MYVIYVHIFIDLWPEISHFKLKRDFYHTGILHPPGSWSESWKTKLLSESLTVEDLDQIAEDFVAAANEGQHKDKGFPGAIFAILTFCDIKICRHWVFWTIKVGLVSTWQQKVGLYFCWKQMYFLGWHSWFILWYLNQILTEKSW